jgi:hypothetical protein
LQELPFFCRRKKETPENLVDWEDIMNILGVLLGAFAVKQVSGYPQEINDLKRQMPKADREAFLKQYKQLPGKEKTDFKAALAKADIAEAGKILGQDLSKYNIAMTKPAEAVKPEGQAVAPMNVEDQTGEAAPESDIITRINKILATPTSIDPELVAEAARRYEESVPSAGGVTALITKPKLEITG